MEKYYYTHHRIAEHVGHMISRDGYAADIVQLGSEWCLSTNAPRRTVIDAATIAAKRNPSTINI